MKKIFILALYLMTFLALYSNPVLVSDKAENLLSNDRCLYHDGNNVIKILDSSEAVHANIIDENYQEGTYYLLHNITQNEIRSDWGRVIYHNQTKFILKSTDDLTMNLSPQGIKCIPLQEIMLSDTNRKFNSNAFRSRDEIDDMISLMSADSLGSKIQALQDFGTRFCLHPNREEVSDWIYQELLGMGITTGIVEFPMGDTFQYDVVGQIDGSVNPERCFLIGGHYDSIVNQGDPMLGAPGADDNASSVAATLEVARVIMESGYQPRNTLIFCAYAAEEVGLVGSFVLADILSYAETDLDFVLNNDMIANNSQSPDNWSMSIVQYTGYEYLRHMSQALIPQYSSLNMGYVGQNSASSDSYPFFVYGFPVVYYLETEFSPWYHSLADVIDNCDIDYCTEIAKVDLAMLITMDMMPVPVEDLIAIDAGDGESVLLEWSSSNEPAFEEYHVYAGIEPGVYDQNFTTIDTMFTVTGLTEDQTAYLGVGVVNSDEMESFLSEISITPLSLPRTPQEFSASALPDGISLSWLPNEELDIEGYNIYRRTEIDPEFELLNAQIISDNAYIDTEIEPLIYYHYYVIAVDTDGNISANSEEAVSRMATLDQGVLLVDITQDIGSGFGNPDPIAWNNFYQAVLLGYSPDFYDLQIEDTLPDYELVTYSTVILCQDRNTPLPGMYELIPALQKYLQLGGNLIISGFRSIDSFFECQEFPCEFEPEHDAYTMFGIQSVDYSQNARLLTAQPYPGDLQALQVDPDKTLPYFEDHLPFIEVYEPAPEADSLYWWDSDYEDGSNFGIMNGRNIAIYQDNGISKTAVLAFPLFYMYQEDAQQLMDDLLTEYMGEFSDYSEAEITTPLPYLYDNYPNPFNPVTSISFTLPEPGTAELSIYNIKGQKVITLMNGILSSGRHTCSWQGNDDTGKFVSSGIYFYQLRTDNYAQTRKMLMLK